MAFNPQPRRQKARAARFAAPAASEKQPAVKPAAMSSYTLEAHCLGILLRKPNLLYLVDRHLQENGLARLAPDDFEHADHKTIIRLFQDSLDQDLGEPLDFVMNNMSLPLMDLADGLLARTEKLDPNEERVLEDLMRGLLDLRRRRLHQELDYQRFLIEESQVQGDIRATQHLQYMVKLAEAKRRIDYAMKKYSSRSPALRS